MAPLVNALLMMLCCDNTASVQDRMGKGKYYILHQEASIRPSLMITVIAVFDFLTP